ncbi:MAG: TRAP transporter small permease [Clostridiales bacterium]|nr:TRAP transporter small permease [Clostridiales bacterium]
MKNLNITVRKVYSIANGIAAVILAILLILLILNIIARFVKNPISGSYEGVQYGFALIVALGIGLTTLSDKNIYIDLLFNKYPQIIKSPLEIVNHLIGISTFALITWRLCVDAKASYMLTEKSSTLGLPVYLFKYLLALGFALVGIAIVMKAFELIGGQKCRQ